MPVTKNVAAVKTDAAVWASRIIKILDNLGYVEELTGQLREDLRTDEMARQSHDNFYSQCLGRFSGILAFRFSPEYRTCRNTNSIIVIFKKFTRDVNETGTFETETETTTLETETEILEILSVSRPP